MKILISLSAIFGILVLFFICLVRFLSDFNILKTSENDVSVKKSKKRNLFMIIKTRYEKINFNVRLLINIIVILFVTRVILYLFAYVGYVVFGNETRSFFQVFESMWVNCDAPRYMQIIKEWYVSSGDYNKMINIAFFPFYPLLVKVVFFVVRDYFYSAILMSFISLVIACFFFYKTLILDYSEDVSFRAVKYFLIYPWSIFLSAVYPESTFMAVTFMCFYFIRKKKWLLASIFAMLAAFCRTQGIILLAPILYEILLDIKDKRIFNLNNEDEKKKPFIDFRYMYCLLVPVGYLGYLIINKVVAGEWFKYMSYQKEYWRNEFDFFGNSITRWIDELGNQPIWTILVSIPHSTFFFIALVLIIRYSREIRTSYLIFVLPYIVISYSVSLPISGPRYLIGAFPMFIAVSLATKNKKIDNIISFLCIMFFTIVAICYAFDRNIL